MNKLRIAVIGGGAVAETFHLPASKLTNEVAVTLLVDKALDRAHRVAARYKGLAVSDDINEVVKKADAALIALPNHLHAAVAIQMLTQGIHVLVEKPMATTTRECEEMLRAAKESGATLAVALVRRFYQSSRFIKQIIEAGLLGPIKAFDFREGSVFRWAAASDATFRKESSGGGVLFDTGSHVLDLLLWWLGDYDNLEYYDDAQGGVEADCELRLHMRCGATGIVELSRTRNLRNSFILHGERASLELQTEYDPTIRLSLEGQEYVLSGHAALLGTMAEPAHNGWPVFDAFCAQFEDFALAIANGNAPAVPGEEGMKSVQLIESCYSAKRPLGCPWLAE